MLREAEKKYRSDTEIREPKSLREHVTYVRTRIINGTLTTENSFPRPRNLDAQISPREQLPAGVLSRAKARRRGL